MPEIAEREPKVISVVLRHVVCVPLGCIRVHVVLLIVLVYRRTVLRSGWREG